MLAVQQTKRQHTAIPARMASGRTTLVCVGDWPYLEGADALTVIDKLLIKLVLQPYWRLTRSQTLGVQGIVVDEQGRILLVRHSYVSGWHLPGGGVERDECLEEALLRELREEAGVLADEKPEWLGIFANFQRSPGDHVAVYIIRKWHRQSEPSKSLEILERRFFALDALPAGTIDGVRRRLQEAFAGRPVSNAW